MFSFNQVCSNLLPVGKYKVQVTDIKFRASATGESTKDMVVNYTVVDGPYAKRTLVDTIYEKSFSFRLKPFLQACKVDMAREFATAEELYRYGLTEAKGKTIMIDVGTKAYNGKEYNQVAQFYPLPDSSTTAEEVLDAIGVEPTVKASATVTDVVEEEMLVPDGEPQLNIPDDDDLDNPF